MVDRYDCLPYLGMDVYIALAWVSYKQSKIHLFAYFIFSLPVMPHGMKGSNEGPPLLSVLGKLLVPQVWFRVFTSPSSCQWLILPLSPLSFIRLSSDNSGSLLNYIIRLLIAEGFDRYHFWIKWTSWSIVIYVFFFTHYPAWSVQKQHPNQYTEKTAPCAEDHSCSKSELLDALILSEWR